MKTIGLIGGTSWQSTVEYYKIINEAVEARLKNNHSAKLLLYSIDFAEVEERINRNAFNEIGDMMVDAAKMLEKAGADCLLMCANTMHMFAPLVQDSITIPLIHIVDSIVPSIKQKHASKLGLLGTKPTMQMDFYKDRYIKEGLQIVVPDEIEMDRIMEIIFTELFKGIINPETKTYLLSLIDGLIREGADGIILGCTELPLIIQQSDVKVPVFDTTELHALAAVDFALKA
ncbi:MAG: aspartate/glutamate racemase family protein [Bacteroidota bacterium]